MLILKKQKMLKGRQQKAKVTERDHLKGRVSFQMWVRWHRRQQEEVGLSWRSEAGRPEEVSGTPGNDRGQGRRWQANRTGVSDFWAERRGSRPGARCRTLLEEEEKQTGVQMRMTGQRPKEASAPKGFKSMKQTPVFCRLILSLSPQGLHLPLHCPQSLSCQKNSLSHLISCRSASDELCQL